MKEDSVGQATLEKEGEAMSDQHKAMKKEREDVQGHERLGLRVNDSNDSQVDLDEDGAIREQTPKNVWS
jgi:hypothetical protein